MKKAPTQTVAGITFQACSSGEAVERLVDSAKKRNIGTSVHFLNAYSLALAHRNDDYRACIKNSSLNFPDGKPLSILTKWSSVPLSQVRGPATFESVMKEGRKVGLSHFLLGGTNESLESLVRALKKRHEGIQIAGVFSPPFRPLSNQEVQAQDDLLRSSGAEVIWVGLGTPKQDFEVKRLASEGFFAVAVGAAFDFSAGTKKEAPAWIRAIGMEWFYRLLSEPRRLWRRYFFGNSVFLWSVVRRGIGK